MRPNPVLPNSMNRCRRSSDRTGSKPARAVNANWTSCTRSGCSFARADGRRLPRDVGHHRAAVGWGSRASRAAAGDGLGRLCPRSPAPGYPDEERTVAECVAVVMDEEIEHYWFAVRDLAVLEAG